MLSLVSPTQILLREVKYSVSLNSPTQGKLKLGSTTSGCDWQLNSASIVKDEMCAIVSCLDCIPLTVAEVLDPVAKQPEARTAEIYRIMGSPCWGLCLCIIWCDRRQWICPPICFLRHLFHLLIWQVNWISYEVKESQQKGEICICKIAWRGNQQREEEMASFQVNTSNGMGISTSFWISSNFFSCLMSVFTKMFSF